MLFASDNADVNIATATGRGTFHALRGKSGIGDWFRTTVGVRQGCLLSPTLFKIFLERIMTDALGNHQGTVSIGGRTITNLRFADDIDGVAGDEQELANLVERLEKTLHHTAWRSVPKRPN